MSAPTPKELKVRAYLKRQLERNPWDASEQIVGDRARALRLKKPTAAAVGPDPGEKRQQLRAELDKLRAEAFTAPLPDLRQRLDALRLDGFPDLQAAGERMRVILASRGVLPTLVDKPGFNPHFLDCFKQVLVAPARDTAVLRERVLSSFSKRKLRKPGVRMIRLLEREAPALCQLERAWLDSLLKSKGGRSTGRFFDGLDTNISWRWAAFLIFFVVSPLVRYSMRQENEKPTYQPPAVTAPQTQAGVDDSREAEGEYLRRGREELDRILEERNGTPRADESDSKRMAGRPQEQPPDQDEHPPYSSSDTVVRSFTFGADTDFPGPRYVLHTDDPAAIREFDAIVQEYEKAAAWPQSEQFFEASIRDSDAKLAFARLMRELPRGAMTRSFVALGPSGAVDVRPSRASAPRDSGILDRFPQPRVVPVPGPFPGTSSPWPEE